MNYKFNNLALVVIFAIIAVNINLYAQNGEGKKTQKKMQNKAQIGLKDGSCDSLGAGMMHKNRNLDNFVDEDGDGICDNKNNESGQSLTGCKGKCINFVDANNDGVCDNMADGKKLNFKDEDGDGVCDNKGNCENNCNGNGKNKGKGKGKKNCNGGSCNSDNQNLIMSEPYPNPFTVSVNLKFEIKVEGSVNAGVYDYSGNLIKEFVNGSLNAGTYEYTFTPENLTAGKYYFKVQIGEVVKTRPIIYNN